MQLAFYLKFCLSWTDIYAVPPSSSDEGFFAVVEQKTKAEEAYITAVFTLAAQSPILLYVKVNHGRK